LTERVNSSTSRIYPSMQRGRLEAGPAMPF
jgi:hypothetical protein